MIASQESMTAKLCSFARAYHSLLGKDKIFDDYLAYDIIGKDEYDKIGRLVAGDAAEDAAVYGFESLKPFARLNRCFTPVALSRTAFAEQALARFSVSDHLLTGESCTAEERQTSFNDMIRIALETAIED